MRSIQKILSLSTILAILLSSGFKLKAQNQSNLSALECRTTPLENDSQLKAREPNFPINIGEISFYEIAYMYNKYLADFGDVLGGVEDPAKVFCKIRSGFYKLNLAVGFDNDSRVTDKEDIVLLEVYIEGKLSEQLYVRRGEIQKISVNVKGIQNIAIQAECLRPEWWNNCPRLSFTEIILQ